MNVLKNENSIFFDVDETLILHQRSYQGNHRPSSSGDEFYIYDERIDRTVVVKLHDAHLDIMKQSKARGRLIFVWSAGGYQWAQMVIEQLCLTSFVDFIMTKPSAYVDDVDANKFMNRVYIEPKKGE